MSLKDMFQELRDFDVQDLNDVERMGVWPLGIKLIIAIVLTAGVFGLTYNYMVKPDINTLSRVTLEEDELKQRYESKAFQVANLDAYREQLEGMRLTFGALLRQLPNETAIPALLDDINNTGAQAGIDITGIDILSAVDRELFVEQPFRVDAIGEYHELGNFASGLAGLPRIVTLHDFSISLASDSTGDAPLKVTFQAKTYRYLDSE
jgi:type IV pilus assembly protein PilO